MFRRQHCALLGVLVEGGEHFLLNRHRLKYSLDDEIRVLDVLEADDAVDEAHAFGRRIGGNAAARRGVLVILLHGAHAALELFFAGLDQRHRNAGIGERHRDAATHGACTDDGDLLDVATLGPFGNPCDFGSLALREKRIALRLRLVAGDQLHEAFALHLQPLIERQVDRVSHCVGRGERRFEAAGLLGHCRDGIGENRAILFGCGNLRVIIAQLAQRHFLGDGLASEGDATCDAILDDFLDQTVLQRLRRGDRIAADDHLDCQFRADRAGQTLSAACAGQKAQLHFRQPKLGVFHGDAEMAAQRGLETAAERSPVDRGNHRLPAVLDRRDHLVEAGFLRRFSELGDVGTGDEGAAAAGQNDAFDLRVRRCGLDLLVDAATNCRAECIDGRAVDHHDADIAMAFKLYHFTHAATSLKQHSLVSQCGI